MQDKMNTMNKKQFKNLLEESANHPETIQGIYNWCDRWCERCSKTANCTVYKTSVQLPSDSFDDLFKSLSVVFEATIDMLKEYAEKSGIDFESMEDSDIEDDNEEEDYLIRYDDGITLSKQYAPLVKQWLDSLKSKNPVGMEVRFDDTVLSDCLEVVQWYQHFLQVKLRRALMAQKDETDMQLDSYDSLGTAKLLLVSIERNIGAWGYIYQKFPEDEDELLAILICLQKLGNKIEQIFPDARAFIRPGLDK